MDRFRDRFTLAVAKDDSRDAEVMASALRTDPRCFRELVIADPVVIELREWSRIAEDLSAERDRLTNRMREQLWRYFPAMLEFESDLGAEWLLDLWEVVPTPTKAARIREATIANILKRHRIRRFDAAQVLDALRKPVQLAAGATEAASAHIATLIARIRLVNKTAHCHVCWAAGRRGAVPQPHYRLPSPNLCNYRRPGASSCFTGSVVTRYIALSKSSLTSNLM
jgi:hypothetical protein